MTVVLQEGTEQASRHTDQEIGGRRRSTATRDAGRVQSEITVDDAQENPGTKQVHGATAGAPPTAKAINEENPEKAVRERRVAGLCADTSANLCVHSKQNKSAATWRQGGNRRNNNSTTKDLPLRGGTAANSTVTANIAGQSRSES